MGKSWLGATNLSWHCNNILHHPPRWTNTQLAAAAQSERNLLVTPFRITNTPLSWPPHLPGKRRRRRTNRRNLDESSDSKHENAPARNLRCRIEGQSSFIRASQRLEFSSQTRCFNHYHTFYWDWLKTFVLSLGISKSYCSCDVVTESSYDTPGFLVFFIFTLPLALIFLVTFASGAWTSSGTNFRQLQLQLRNKHFDRWPVTRPSLAPLTRVLSDPNLATAVGAATQVLSFFRSISRCTWSLHAPFIQLPHLSNFRLRLILSGEWGFIAALFRQLQN